MTASPSVLRRVGGTLAETVVAAILVSVPIANLVALGWSLALMAETAESGAWRTRLPRVRELPRLLRLGALGLVGSMLWIAPSGLLFLNAWMNGWILSFEGVNSWTQDLYAFPFVYTALAAALLVPALAYLPAAQTRFATTGRFVSFFELPALESVRSARPWRWVAWAMAVPVFSVLHGLLRVIITRSDSKLAGFVIVNALLWWPFLAMKLGWARSVYLASRTGPAPKRARPLPLLVGYFLSAAALHASMPVLIFLASYGPFDFVTNPALTVPSAPYPGGIIVPSEGDHPLRRPPYDWWMDEPAPP